MKLRHKLTLANLLFKLGFVILFMIATPWLAERINLYQTDNELIKKRETVIRIISELGVEPFLLNEENDVFGSYNILKEEFISIEPVHLDDFWNFIEVTKRSIDNEIIDYRVLNYSFLIDGKMYLLEIGKSLSSIKSTERNIRKITIGFLLLFLLISVIFEMVYTGMLLRPLNTIIEKIKTTANPANYDKTPIASSTFDFKVLDKTLSVLMSKTEELIAREREITQDISHELMTPVSILRSKLENLLIHDNISKETAEKTQEALDTLHRLKTLISSLLLIARIESRQYLKQDTVEITEVLDEMIDELSPLAEEKNILFKRIQGADFKITNANRSLLFSMFFNVANNAIRHTPQNGSVSVSTTIENRAFCVVIRDNGEGISPELLPRLFMRFKRKMNADDDGSGIGLAIAKSIADYHHIQINVESNPGEGTSFTFIFLQNP